MNRFTLDFNGEPIDCVFHLRGIAVGQIGAQIQVSLFFRCMSEGLWLVDYEVVRLTTPTHPLVLWKNDLHCPISAPDGNQNAAICAICFKTPCKDLSLYVRIVYLGPLQWRLPRLKSPAISALLFEKINSGCICPDNSIITKTPGLNQFFSCHMN